MREFTSTVMMVLGLGIVGTGGVARTESPLQQDAGQLPDLALQPPAIIAPVGAEHAKSERGSQGVPGIERSRGGRLWAAWYAGAGKRGVESPFSYVLLATSGDDGVSWSEKLVIQPRRFVRAMDPCLWIDPQGRLWLFWAQCAGLQDGRWGVWCILHDDPDSEDPEWSTPRRIANGLMLNKPTVLQNGDWLLPVGLWRRDAKPKLALENYDLSPYTEEMLLHDLGDERGSNVIRSRDQGETFEFLGQARVPNTPVDEHMIVERRDGSLWMLLRNTRGIAQSVSTDGGRTWDAGSFFLQGRQVASKRFFLRRLQSGALLLVRNNGPTGARTHMTAFLSDDDGFNWTDGFLLEERESSDPDGVQADSGAIYIIYDHQRYTLNRDGQEGVGAVLMAVFHEADVRAGRPVTGDVRLRVDVTRLRADP